MLALCPTPNLEGQVLVTRTKQALIDTFQKLKQEAEKNGLTINQNKTKYMRHSRMQINGKDKELEIEGMKIEEVSKTKNTLEQQ